MPCTRHRIGFIAVTLLLAVPAAAQTFPEEGHWSPLPCGGGVMGDRLRDQSGAVDERDLVGDQDAPAGYSALDATFLYLRLRLDGDPAPGGKLRPFAWGVELSVDSDPSTYEVLLLVNGTSGMVELYRNSTTTQPDDPADPADQPPLASYPFTSHGRAAVAPGSSYAGDDDHFLAWAVPWSELAPLGLHPLAPLVLWAGSSSSPNALNGDLACHDGAGGAPTLSQLGGVTIIIDAAQDSDGDGYPDRTELVAGTDPQDPASHPTGPPPVQPGSDLAIEGGGGCTIGRDSIRRAALPLVLALLAAGLFRRRWRARRRT